MPYGMGVTNPKLAKSVRKPKKTKNIALFLSTKKKESPPVELQIRTGNMQK